MINKVLSISIAFLFGSLGVLALVVAFGVLNDVFVWFPIYRHERFHMMSMKREAFPDFARTWITWPHLLGDSTPPLHVYARSC